MDILIFAFEIIGTVAFSVSGAMTGLKKNMDIFGVMILGVVTAIGGGVTLPAARPGAARFWEYSSGSEPASAAECGAMFSPGRSRTYS